MNAPLPAGYIRIAGEWSYAPLRVGLVVRAPDGQEIYIQPGDDETAMRANIEALDEISEDTTDAKRATICAMILGEYFQ
jgi:hypothetical protein